MPAPLPKYALCAIRMEKLEEDVCLLLDFSKDMPHDLLNSVANALDQRGLLVGEDAGSISVELPRDEADEKAVILSVLQVLTKKKFALDDIRTALDPGLTGYVRGSDYASSPDGDMRLELIKANALKQRVQQ